MYIRITAMWTQDLKKGPTNMKKASSSSGSIRRVVYSEESESAEVIERKRERECMCERE